MTATHAWAARALSERFLRISASTFFTTTESLVSVSGLMARVRKNIWRSPGGTEPRTAGGCSLRGCNISHDISRTSLAILDIWGHYGREFSQRSQTCSNAAKMNSKILLVAGRVHRQSCQRRTRINVTGRFRNDL